MVDFPMSYSALLVEAKVALNWTKKFPHMPTERREMTAVCTGSALIVAGGKGRNGVLSTVEVMNTENHHWSTAANLPQPMLQASATVCGDQFYMLGGQVEQYGYTKSAYTCSLSDLLLSFHSRRSQLATSQRTNIWRKIADLPVTRSTCESFHGRLLAIGGRDSERFSTAVHMYNSTTNSWEIIDRMSVGRWNCFTAVLPDNRLMVVGGFAEGGITRVVELASVCI